MKDENRRNGLIFSNNLIISKKIRFWKMANPRNFRNLFVKLAHIAVFITPKREKQSPYSNLLEIFHCQPDSFLCDVERFDLYTHLIADGKHFRGVLDEFF